MTLGQAEPEWPDSAMSAAEDRWAVCCSGGGLRSTLYCLGALQALERTGFLARARLIVGVSSGGHIAASRALIDSELHYGYAERSELDSHGLPDSPVYAPGSPEERQLRTRVSYPEPGPARWPTEVLTLLFSVTATLLVVLPPVFAAAHVWGWILRSQGVLTPPPTARSAEWTVSLTSLSWWIWPVAVAGAAVVNFVEWRVTLPPDIPDLRGDPWPSPHGRRSARPRRRRVAVRAVDWAALAALLLAAVMLVVPALTAWVSGPHSGVLKTVLDDLGFGSGATWAPFAGGLVLAVVAVSQSTEKYLVERNLPSAPAAARTVNARTGAARRVTVAGSIRGFALPWLASVLVLLAGLVIGLRWVEDGAAAGFAADQGELVLAALATTLVLRFAVDVNRLSTHDLRRWRLDATYAVGRSSDPDGVNLSGARLTQLSSRSQKLVLCTTVGSSPRREALPSGGKASFTFDPDYATLRSTSSSASVRARTSDYEALVGSRRFTLFDVAAISGAALPLQISAGTRLALRILFTATGLRQGMWLPHPAVVRAAAERLDRQHLAEGGNDRWWSALRLLCWYLAPHPVWRPRDEERETRLWAYLLRMRRTNRILGGLLYRAMQPTFGLLYAEATGRASYRDTWICVTDGGHYDNLGLVEALQRAPESGFDHILVLDASGDQADTWSTLGGSIARARADTEIEVELDPTAMIRGGRDLAPGQVVRPWAQGRFNDGGVTRKGEVVVCKLGWWTGAPWDVVAYARQHPSYPAGDSSGRLRLYDATDFEAYRQLGAAAIADLARHLSVISESAEA